MIVNDYEHEWPQVIMSNYERWTNMSDYEIFEQYLLTIYEREQKTIYEWEWKVVCEWKWRTIYEWQTIYEWWTFRNNLRIFYKINFVHSMSDNISSFVNPNQILIQTHLLYS